MKRLPEISSEQQKSAYICLLYEVHTCDLLFLKEEDVLIPNARYSRRVQFDELIMSDKSEVSN